jgi:hypothetical protein
MALVVRLPSFLGKPPPLKHPATWLTALRSSLREPGWLHLNLHPLIPLQFVGDSAQFAPVRLSGAMCCPDRG